MQHNSFGQIRSLGVIGSVCRQVFSSGFIYLSALAIVAEANTLMALATWRLSYDEIVLYDFYVCADWSVPSGFKEFFNVRVLTKKKNKNCRYCLFGFPSDVWIALWVLWLFWVGGFCNWLMEIRHMWVTTELARKWVKWRQQMSHGMIEMGRATWMELQYGLKEAVHSSLLVTRRVTR